MPLVTDAVEGRKPRQASGGGPGNEVGVVGLTQTGEAAPWRVTRRAIGAIGDGLRDRAGRAVRWAAAFAVVAASIAPAVAATGDGVVSDASATLADAASRLIAAARGGLDRHPAAMLALAAGALLPVLAIASSLTRATSRLLAARQGAAGAATLPPVARGFDVAWIERDGAGPTRIGELTRIGSVDDCELAITPPASGGEHMLHAVIQRTPEREFVVFDVARGADRAITVNGEPARVRRLADGDEITIGAERFVFRLGPGFGAAQTALMT